MSLSKGENGVTNGIRMLTKQMKELDKFNLEDRKTGLESIGWGVAVFKSDGYQVEEGICFATKDRIRIGFRDMDFDQDQE